MFIILYTMTFWKSSTANHDIWIQLVPHVVFYFKQDRRGTERRTMSAVAQLNEKSHFERLAVGERPWVLFNYFNRPHITSY